MTEENENSTVIERVIVDYVVKRKDGKYVNANGYNWQGARFVESVWDATPFKMRKAAYELVQYCLAKDKALVDKDYILVKRVRHVETAILTEMEVADCYAITQDKRNGY